MDDAGLVSAFVGARMGQVQLAVAANMLRMDADSVQAVVKLIDAAHQNIDRLANVRYRDEPRRQRITAGHAG